MAAFDEVGRLGVALQKARQAGGLTQQELCHKADLSYSTLAKIERGAIKSPSIFTIQSVANALDVTLNDLMSEVVPISHKTPETPKKRSRNGVRFIYFDINGCLVRFFHRAFTRLAEDSGAPADTIETIFWHYNDIVCRGEMTIEEFNATLAKHLGLQSVDWRQYYIDAIDPIPEMQELIAWTATHYHVGLLSNIMPGFISYMRENKLLPDITYSAIIDSSEVKAIKPELRIYEVATEATGIDASEILLIDDSRSNLMAAERLSWHVLWFDDYRPDESVERIRNALEPAD